MIMNRFLSFVWVLGALFVSSAQATPIQLPGVSCQGGALRLITGNAFSAHCAGDLRFDRFTTIQAEESIFVSALGNAVIEGRLSAPQIIIIAGAEVTLAEASVLLVNRNGIEWDESTRVNGGALILTGAGAGLDSPVAVGRLVQPPNSPGVVISGISITAVPEPASALLLMIGGAMMVWLRHPRRLNRWATGRTAQGA